MRWFLFGLMACATPEQRRARAEYFRTHPMAECRELMHAEQANRGLAKGAEYSTAGMSGKPVSQNDQPINPCAIGCRIPACGYLPAPGESP